MWDYGDKVKKDLLTVVNEKYGTDANVTDEDILNMTEAFFKSDGCIAYHEALVTAVEKVMERKDK